MGYRTLGRILDGMYAAACKGDLAQVQKINRVFSPLYDKQFPNWGRELGIDILPTAFNEARNACVIMGQEGFEDQINRLHQEYKSFRYELRNELRAAKAHPTKIKSATPLSLSLSL